MTGNHIINSLRMRCNDEGDDTQNIDGTPNKQYFWSTNNELLVYANIARLDIFRLLVDEDKRNELKNLIADTTADDLSAVSDYFHAFHAEIDDTFASLFIDPRGLSHISQTKELAVTIVGYDVIRNTGVGQRVWYYKRPSAIVATDDDMTEMTNSFYEAVIEWAEYLAVHKDLSTERVVLRRDFGKQDIQVEGILEYLQQAQ